MMNEDQMDNAYKLCVARVIDETGAGEHHLLIKVAVSAGMIAGLKLAQEIFNRKLSIDNFPSLSDV